MTKESGRPTYKIYVGNLAPNTSDYDLVRVFSQYGEVIEAVSLGSKGFGFVHMASEEEGARAMKSLYKYLLNGKEMVVQPAINPKKASVSGHFSNKKRAAIGRGIGTLDDFDDNFHYDQLFEQELAQCIESESLGSNHSSPTAQYHQYSSSANSHSVAQLTNFSDVLASNEPDAASIAAAVGSINGTNGAPGISNGVTSAPNGLPSSNNLLPSLPVLSNGSTVNQGASNFWGNLDVSKSNGSTGILSNSSLAQSYQPASSILDFNKSGGLNQAILNEQLRNGQLKAALSLPSSQVNGLMNTVRASLPQQQQQQQLQATQQQVLANQSRIQQEYSLIQNQLYSGQLSEEQQMLLKLQQKQLQESEAQNMLMQQKIQQQLLSNSVNLNGNILGVNVTRPLAVTSSVPNVLDMNSTSSNIMNSFPKMNSSLSNGNNITLGNNNSLNMNGNSSNVPVHRCRLCNEAYNSSNRVPKILGCTHTFCLSCLMASTSPTGQVQCPIGCGVPTQLSEAGLSGLTTNQGLVNMTSSLSADNLLVPSNGVMPQVETEVCASCTGTQHDQPIVKCKQEGHTLIKAEEAKNLMLNQLRPNIERTLLHLREVMKMRANTKERVESTLQSLAKFVEELKNKLHQDALEEEVLISTLNDLTRLMQHMQTQTYSDLVCTFHSVETCAKDIASQYTQCTTSSLVNAAVEALVLKLHTNSMNALQKMGLSQSEVFRMDQSLHDHARSGNYANVLLQYMVADMLGSRLKQRGSLHQFDLGSVDADNVTQGTYDVRPSASLSPGVNSTNGVMSSSGTPDIAAMNGNNAMDSIANNMEHMDITCLLQTTEAIEADNRARADMASFNDDTSLGLSSICHFATNTEETVPLDLEKSLLEGSASIEPEVPVKVISSAPSPSSSNSITPPIGASSHISNVSNNNQNYKHANSAPEMPPPAQSPVADNGAPKPFSYLDAAKKPAKPQPEPQPKAETLKLPIQVKQIKTPHCWMKVTVDGEPIGRIVFQLRPDKAPKMCENFLGLCTGKPGYGYKGTHFFKNGDGFLAGGDVEFDDGSGGYSIYNNDKFEADLCPLKDEVGMIRFKGNGTSENGRGMVGSQFMVWYAEREFKKFSFSLVFGRVVDGMDVVKKAAGVNLSKHDVMIEDCGGVL